MAPLVDRELLDAYEAASEEEIAATLDGLSGPTAAHRVTLWAFTVRQPAFTFLTPGRMLSHVTDIMPCIDLPFLRHFLQLGATEIVAKNFYRRLILRALPSLRDVPYHATGRPISDVHRMPSRMSPTTAVMHLAKSPFFGPRPLRRLAAGAFRRTLGRRGFTTESRVWLRLFRDCDLSASPYLSRKLRREGIDGLTPLAAGDIQLLGIQLALAWSREYLRTYRPHH